MEILNPPEITEKIKLLGSSINKDFDYNEWLNRFNRLLILITVKNENIKKFDLLLLLEEGFRNFQNIITENNKFKKLFKIILFIIIINIKINIKVKKKEIFK